MNEFQLTHVALVGARMDAFRAHGYRDRNELTMRVVVPGDIASLAELPAEEIPIALKSQLPIWVHNIITDTAFPRREKLLMPLRRFEGELQDSKHDEVVASVLSAGFRNQHLDPLNLPAVMPMRQRCAIVMHLGTWQEAFKALEQDLVAILSGYADELVRWCRLFSEEEARCLLLD
jgi:hypothetical protein